MANYLVRYEGRTIQSSKPSVISKTYEIDQSGFDGEIAALRLFRAEFAEQIPAYKPGKMRFSTYGRRFSVRSQ